MSFACHLASFTANLLLHQDLFGPWDLNLKNIFMSFSYYFSLDPIFLSMSTLPWGKLMCLICPEVYSQDQEQCLAESYYSTNICKSNEKRSQSQPSRECWKRVKISREVRACRFPTLPSPVKLPRNNFYCSLHKGYSSSN